MPFIVLALNTAEDKGRRIDPFYALYGRKCPNPWTTDISRIGELLGLDETIARNHEQMRFALEVAKDHLRGVEMAYAKVNAGLALPAPFQLGDRVQVLFETKTGNQFYKWVRHYKGPYQVVAVGPRDTFLVAREDGQGKMLRVRTQRLSHLPRRDLL